MTNFLITILKHLSVNDKGYPFLKNTCFKKVSSSWNFVYLEQILKCQSARVYIIPNLYTVGKKLKMGTRATKTIKMGIHATR